MEKGNIESMVLPTKFGTFRLWVWNGDRGREPVALSTLRLDPKKEVLVRVHSECLTGDVFGSQTCDCGPQKELALQKIHQNGNGIFIYHRQEGRNMGLFKKVQAYNLMQDGADTHEANLKLVGHPDSRDYDDVLAVLGNVLSGHKSGIRLLTNNPYKVLFLERHGYSVFSEPLQIGATPHNAAYTESKTRKFLHNSVGFGPYVSVTLHRAGLKVASGICKVVEALDRNHKNRKLFFGVAVFPEAGDLLDESLIEEIQTFYHQVAEHNGISLVLHMNYPLMRQTQRQLTRFLSLLTIPYSLQFRVPKNEVEKIRVDVDFLDALHGEYVIFQMRERDSYLLDQSSFTNYFAHPNKFLLADESWGTGTSKDLSQTKEKLLTLVSRGLSRLAVAGGYDASRLNHVHELEDYFKIPISVDAESKLCTNGAIDLSKVQAYLSYFFPARVC